MNNCNFTGRLTKDPELKHTNSGTAVLDFSLAVDRRDKEKHTDFIPCKAWSVTAETMSNYLRKGSLIAINGRLESRSYDTNDGSKRTVYEIVVNSFEFLEKRAADPAPAQVPTPPPVSEEAYTSELDDCENNLPFSI